MSGLSSIYAFKRWGNVKLFIGLVFHTLLFEPISLKSLACVGFKTYGAIMEQFIIEVAAFAALTKKKPATVIQNAVGLSGSTWGKWVKGDASPQMKTVEKIRKYMKSQQIGAES